jgi:hypothetical protein
MLFGNTIEYFHVFAIGTHVIASEINKGEAVVGQLMFFGF